MTSERTQSTQRRLEALFSKSSSARIRFPVGGYLDSPKQPTLVTVAEERLAQLRAALELSDDGVPIGCHCAGTVTVELVGNGPPNTILTLHLHRQMCSLWIAGDTNGARLRERQEILDRLAEWGISAPLEIVTEADSTRTRRGPTAGELAGLAGMPDELKPDNPLDAGTHQRQRRRRRR